MTLRAAIVLLMLARVAAFGQGAGDLDLARMLSTESDRGRAVSEIVTSGAGKKSLLLSWTRNPPANIDLAELNIGLADAFGQMKTKEAIPFLIKNISIDRTHAVNTWLKAPDVIEGRLAAAAALIRIGPDAADAVVRACWRPMRAEDRLAAIFVVSRTVDYPGAKAFLTWALGEANQERFAAEEGLKRISRSQ